jgi:hypothetical protein
MAGTSKSARPGKNLAVAVRDGADLFVVITINRGPEGDVYVNWPRDHIPGWNPHTSYHASGQHHHKSFNQKLVVFHEQKPDANFRGAKRISGTPVNTTDPRKVNHPCDPEKLDGVVEIPLSDLRPEMYRHVVTVDFVQPNHVANIVQEKRMVRQTIFRDSDPWIVVTLFETFAPGDLQSP